MFFVLSKALWFVVNPFNVIMLLFLLGTLLIFWKPRAGRKIIAACLILLFVSGLDFLPNYLIGLLENRIPPQAVPDKINGIIVLAGSVDMEASRHNLIELNDQADRIISGIILAQRHPGARLALTGSSGELYQRERFKEADYLKKVALSLGIDEDRLIIERESRNTREHAVAMSKLLTKASQWVLITSAFHMPRSYGCFKKEGLNVIPYPVDYKTASGNNAGFALSSIMPRIGNIGRFGIALHEWIGLIAYKIMGYTEAIFPKA